VKCPFCAEHLDAEAIVCKTCGRDVTVPLPVMKANRDLEFKVEELEEENAKLRMLLKQARVADAVEHCGLLCALATTYVVLPVVTLVAIHSVFVVWLDVNVWLLNFAFAPPAMIFGYLLESRWRPSWRWTVLLSAVISIASIVGMSLTLYIKDNSPIIPTNWPEWSMTLALALNIGLAFILGTLIGSAATAALRKTAVKPNGFAGAIALAMAKALPHKKGASLETRLAYWHRVVRVAASILTAVGVIVSGISRFHSNL